MKTGVHLIVLASLMLPAIAQSPAAAPAPELEPGQKLDDKAVVFDLDGKPHKLRDLLGKVTVVNFHSIKSAPQREADARLQELEKSYGKRGVSFLHINSNADEVGLKPQKPSADPRSPKPYSRLRKHLDKHKLDLRMFADHHNRVADRLGALTTPHVFVFSQDGTLIYRGCIAYNERTLLVDALDKLVAGKAVQPHEHYPFGSAISRAEARTTAEHHTVVMDDIMLAHKTALREDKLLLYSFSGFNCASCRIMEDAIFTKDEVQAVMRKHVVESRLHTDAQRHLTDDQFAANRRMQKQLAKNFTNPYYVVVDPGTGKTVGTFELSGGWDSWQPKWMKFVGDTAKQAGRRVE